MPRKARITKAEQYLRRLAKRAGITAVDEAMELLRRVVVGVRFEANTRDEVVVGWFKATAKLYPILKADLDVLGPKYKAKTRARRVTRRK